MRVGSELTDRAEPVLYLSIITHNCVTCRLGPIGFNEAVSGKLRDIQYRCQDWEMLTGTVDTALQRKSPFVFLFWELRGLSPNFHVHVSESDLYIPRIGQHISCSRIGMNVEIGTAAAQFLFWKYLFQM
jgi:hypothetical protein